MFIDYDVESSFMCKLKQCRMCNACRLLNFNRACFIRTNLTGISSFIDEDAKTCHVKNGLLGS